KLVLAREETIEKVTGAKVGYAGLLNLPKDVKIFMDESMQGRKNFEMGANKTNYHSVNVNFGRDLPLPEKFHDIKIAKEGDLYPETGEVYDVFKTAEIGNIFPLGTKYAKLFNYYYTDENGKEQLVYMGSYGIGPSRIMGVLVEKYADEKGLVWSDAVAPFRVHLISLKQDDRAQDVYKRLQEKSIDVFYDDRDVSAGQKFADADLLGIPVRLVVSPKTGEKIEWKKRTEQTTELLDLDMIFARLQK
ncbi:MAG: hypothetical protein KGL95_13380, partial [Patescibacteria group bacterium]|nr:hypothetical protein [Patescibacteria group bacterium]